MRLQVGIKGLNYIIILCLSNREFIDATKEDIEDLQSRDLDGTSTAQVYL